jgi:uncharacterized protein (TIGR02246 family)
MDRAAFESWIERYERAWRAPGTEQSAELFTPDASYRTAPFEEPYLGLEAIERMWEAEREGPDEPFEMDSEVVAVEGDTGVARLEVRYLKPGGKTYRDIWIVTLDDQGRCTEFEEWPFWPPESGGSYHSPAGGDSESGEG